jgi:hypothetical protein
MFSHNKIRGIGIALAGALALSQAAVAAPSVQLVKGNTKVTLSAELLEALGSLGVTPATVLPGSVVPDAPGVTVIFPIPTGELDSEGPKLEILHSGGLTLTAGDTRVALTSFIIENINSEGTLQLTGVVKANDTIVGRIPLFLITLTEAPNVTPGSSTVAAEFSVRKAAVTLTSEAADALNGAFGLAGVFTADFPIGTAKIIARLRDLDG